MTHDYLTNLPKIKFPKIDSFKATTLVKFEIRCKENSAIHKAFLNWQIENGIYSERGAGYAGPNMIIAYFSQSHAPKVAAWLKREGLREYKDVE